MACTLLCESGSTGSIPVRHPKTDPRFVRLCGEQSDILLNSVISREHKAYKHFERTSTDESEVRREKVVINFMQANDDGTRIYSLGRS